MGVRVMSDEMLQCSACGREISTQASYCQYCGAAQAPAGHRPPDPYLLLMTANVLRLRRQWALAEAKCSELLKLDPQNAAAHSLMGDILRDQGRVPDAIEWYKLAVDRDPANETDRRKLEALIDQRFTERGGSCVLRSAKSLLGRWLRPAREEARAPRPVCPWAMVTAGVFAVTLLGAFTMLLVGKKFSPPRPRPPATPAAPVASVETAPPVEAAAPPPALTGDIAALEQAVFEQVRDTAAVLEANCQVNGAQVDPRTAQVEIEISMPAFWAPAATRKQLLRMASALAPVSAKVDPHFTALKVRGLARHSSGVVELAMVAEGKAESFRRVSNPVTGESLEKLFATVWWSDGLRPEDSSGAGRQARSGVVVPTAEGR